MYLPRQRTLLAAGLLAALAALSGGLLCPAAQTSSAPEGAGLFHAPHVSVGLVPLSGSIQPGGSTEVGLHFLLEKGWHVYWVNAGDSGEPPNIEWKLPNGITAGPMLFPTPQRLPYGPLMDFGYEDEVLFPVTLHAAPELKAPSTVQLGAHVTWLVCREVCIPEKADFMLPVKTNRRQSAPNDAAATLFARFNARMPQPLPPGSKAVFAATPSSFILAVSGKHGGEPASSAEYFPLDQNQINNDAPQPIHAGRGGTLEISLTKDENLRENPNELRGVLRFANGTAYVIRAVPGSVPGVLAASTGGSGTNGNGQGDGGGLAHVLRIALLAFAGGVILNLMPCVFPVLFIKGLALVGSSGESRNRQRAHGAAYALGILVSFWAVAAILLALRAGGHRPGWGFQFQSPVFLAVVALLLFFLGLSLAGVFEIGLTLTGKGSSLAAQGGYAGSFFTGVLAMVVATPCTAPFMGVAVGFALVQPAAIAYMIFTALALGLAAPYVLLTLQPAWTRLLPKPGIWMEILKQATAIPVFAFAIWVIWLFAQLAGIDALSAGLLPGFLLLAVAAWILGRWPARRNASLAAGIVIAAAVALPVYALHSFPAPQEDLANSAKTNSKNVDSRNQDGWQPFSDAALQRYRAQGRPVFVDFTASWCLSCQVNERVVLDRSDVRQRLRDSGIVLMRADWTRHDDAVTQALNQLGRDGVPTYVIYRSGEPAKVLPEVLTPGIVFNALAGIEAPQGQDQDKEASIPGQT